jgi:hypothetical protein
MAYIFKHRHPPQSWKEFRHRHPHPILRPFVAMEFATEWIAFLLSRWAFMEVLEYVGSFSILVAVIFYFAEAGERTQARHYQAWQVINTAQGKGGSGGRIDALAQLNDDHVPLVGVDVSLAFLQGVRLEKADLSRGNLNATDLRDAHLAGAKLEWAALSHANLRGADLRRVDLRHADLWDADLVDADLGGMVGWETIERIDDADIRGVKNAPPGFVEWAMKHGATNAEPSTAPASRP